jgi:uncharacterized protein (TIGR02594 family)
MPKFVSATYTKSTLTVQYVADNGDILLRSGGTIAWRFNNPGNMRPKSKYVKTSIGIGNTASGDFFIFPDYATGRSEKKALLRRKYNTETIASAMQIYAPPSENDTEAYINYICDHTGFSRDQQISSMNDGQLDAMMNAMEKREGYYAKIDTRHEQWVKTASVTVSDGAQPIPNLPVVVKSNGQESKLSSNQFGQLLIPYDEVGQEIQLLVQDAKDRLKKLGTITTQATSSAHVFFRDLFTATAIAPGHYADEPKRSEKKASFRYKIVSGDTLSRIATKFKTTVEQIKKDNHLKSTRIFAGDFLMINGEKPKQQGSPRGNTGSRQTASSQTGRSGTHTSLSDLDGSSPKNSDASKPISDTPATQTAPPAKTDNAPLGASQTVSPDRSKLGQGHPLALIPAVSQQAPWMEKALDQAKYWHGQKEDVITKTINYHKAIGLNLPSLVGTRNAWCASFVNWCLRQAGYPISDSPADSQSFRWSKNFVKIEKAVFGAIAVYKHTNGGHAAFVYAKSAHGDPILLGGNQSDAIDFTMMKPSELKGFYVPSSYLKYANGEIDKGTILETSTPAELNKEFNIQFKQKTHDADR